jgi:predicted component of type VI protein secretion system
VTACQGFQTETETETETETDRDRDTVTADRDNIRNGIRELKYRIKLSGVRKSVLDSDCSILTVIALVRIDDFAGGSDSPIPPTGFFGSKIE